jgi:glycosyltransferase involved in cell wall biosynthesis
MNILVIAQPNTAFAHMRLTMPYALMHGKDNITIDFLNVLTPESKVLGIDIKVFLKDYEWVVFSRMLHPVNGVSELVAKIVKDARCKIMLDLDDYWFLPSNHIMYKEYQATKKYENILDSIGYSDVITVTTELLKKMVLQSFPNKKVYVLPNALDTSLSQYNPKQQNKSDVCRFGYLGSITHEHDIALMQYSFNKLWSDNSLNFKIYLCGYSVYNGERKGQPYPNMEKVMTANYKRIGNQYNLEESYVFPDTYPYQRVKYNYDLNSYANAYNLFDVSFAPLENNLFNRCKSELKMIEAGVMKKAIVVSNIYPFSILINDKNCLSVSDNTLGWYNAFKKLIKNPNLVIDISEQLHLDVSERYNLHKINDIRKEILFL